MTRPKHLALGMCAALTLVAVRADAQPGGTPASILQEASRAIEAGEYEQARALARSVLSSADAGRDVDQQDRAEAWRVSGLALFFLDSQIEAEAAFIEYLKLDVNGRLDPALVPPEAVVFFESVRAKHAGVIETYRPKPRHKWWYNLIPPAGQFQNGDHKKGWLILGSAVALTSAHVTSYLMLSRWCDARTRVCAADGESRTSSAKTMRQLNVASGVLLIGLGAYGILDGFLNYRNHNDTPSVGVSLLPGGGQLVVQARF